MKDPQGLRILLTVDAVGGVWQYGMDLARGLAEQGVETVLALLGPSPSDEQRSEALRIEGAKLVETGLPLDWLVDDPETIRGAAKAIAALAAQEGVHLIQANMPTLAALPSSLPTVAVTHGCVSTWWAAARPGQPLPDAFDWHRKMTGAGLRIADMVVAPTAAYAEIVARQYGLSEPPCVVHNGRTPIVRQPLTAPLDDRVLTVGRLWDDVKNSALLDRVAGRLIIPFHAAGAMVGPHGETASLANLHSLGSLSAKALGAWLKRQPVFVSAASFEPFGLAVLEAAQAGCALILSDIPTFRELWDGAALFVPTHDEDSYVDAIEQLIGDVALRSRLGTAARERADRYTPQRLADEMLAVYARAIDAKLPKGRAA